MVKTECCIRAVEHYNGAHEDVIRLSFENDDNPKGYTEIWYMGDIPIAFYYQKHMWLIEQEDLEPEKDSWDEAVNHFGDRFDLKPERISRDKMDEMILTHMRSL